MNNLDGILTGVSDALGKLGGAPGYVLVFAFCLAFGFALKSWTAFPNKAIPVAVIFWGMVWNSLIADPKSDHLPLRVWLVKNIVFGGVVGALAWLAHNKRKQIPVIGKWFNEGVESHSNAERGARNASPRHSTLDSRHLLLLLLLLPACATAPAEPDSATDAEVERSVETIHRLRNQLWGETNPSTALKP